MFDLDISKLFNFSFAQHKHYIKTIGHSQRLNF